MKTAVSLPDDLFELAETEAKRLKVSRSELYARAIAEYVKQTRDADITARLNEVYADTPAEIDPVLMEGQRRVWRRDKW